MNSSVDDSRVDPFTGFVVGMAIGDALGLPREGIGRRRTSRMFGTGPVRYGLVLGRGMVSDDTEHLRMTALALLQEPLDARRFARRLAWKLRLWLLALPAGTGMATARAIIRLWLGWTPDCSGVRSAGNGPAMRAGVLGLCLRGDPVRLAEYVEISTRMTHTDPRAMTGAMITALCAAEAASGRVDVNRLFDTIQQLPLDAEWVSTLDHVRYSLSAQETSLEFAARICCERGVSGYIVHSVAAALFCWLRWPDEFRRPIEEIIRLGGDTDSTAAILGGLAGATGGVESIPDEWLIGIIEWPFTLAWTRDVLGPALRSRFDESPNVAKGPTRIPLPYPWPITAMAVVGRNLFFLAVVLFHGLRRLLPPY